MPRGVFLLLQRVYDGISVNLGEQVGARWYNLETFWMMHECHVYIYILVELSFSCRDRFIGLTCISVTYSMYRLHMISTRRLRRSTVQYSTGFRAQHRDSNFPHQRQRWLCLQKPDLPRYSSIIHPEPILTSRIPSYKLRRGER